MATSRRRLAEDAFDNSRT